MGIQFHFDRFHGKIKLGREDDAYKKARKRDDSIKADVKTEFREAGYPIGCGLHPRFAEDAYRDCSDLRRLRHRSGASDRRGQGARKIRSRRRRRALDVLEDRGFKNAKIKKPCVTANYASDNVHIDFIIYKRSGDQYYLAVGKKNSDEDNREWSIADPLGLIEWIGDASDYDDDDAKDVMAQFRRLVRYLKRWRDVQFSESVAGKVFSIGLTVMVKQELVPTFSTEGTRDDLAALRATVKAILGAGYFDEEEKGKYRVRVDLPVEPHRDIFDGSSLDTGTQLYNKLKRLKEAVGEGRGLER